MRGSTLSDQINSRANRVGDGFRSTRGESHAREGRTAMMVPPLATFNAGRRASRRAGRAPRVTHRTADADHSDDRVEVMRHMILTCHKQDHQRSRASSRQRRASKITIYGCHTGDAARATNLNYESSSETPNRAEHSSPGRACGRNHWSSGDIAGPSSHRGPPGVLTGEMSWKIHRISSMSALSSGLQS